MPVPAYLQSAIWPCNGAVDGKGTASGGMHLSVQHAEGAEQLIIPLDWNVNGEQLLVILQVGACTQTIVGYASWYSKVVPASLNFRLAVQGHQKHRQGFIVWVLSCMAACWRDKRAWRLCMAEQRGCQ